MSGPLQRVRAVDRRHPLWWDVTLALVPAAISVRASPQLGPVAVGFLIVVNGAVVFRRRYPFAALLVALGGVGTAAVLTWLADLHLPWAFLAVWVLLFHVGLRYGSVHLVPVGGIIALIALAAFTGFAGFAEPPDSTAVDPVERVRAAVPVAAMCLASFLAGTQVHSHRKAQERQRREAARSAVIAERARIAHEMHDIIGHNLSVITSLANGGAVAAPSSSPDVVRAFEAIGEVSRSSVRQVRRVLTVLRDDHSADGASLSPQPGLDDIDGLVESVRAAGVQVQFARAGELQGLSAGLQLAVYRIVQEALTNTLRHAGSHARVSIRITRDREALVLRVDDSGTPVDAAQRSGPAEPGHGIVGMRERAEAYGGTVQAGAAENGWRVHARIPIDHPMDHENPPVDDRNPVDDQKTDEA